jgi:hypothetical protein
MLILVRVRDCLFCSEVCFETKLVNAIYTFLFRWSRNLSGSWSFGKDTSKNNSSMEEVQSKL